MISTGSSSSWPGRRPLMTETAFLEWHDYWTADMKAYWGSTAPIKVEDYDYNWPYSLRSLYYYRRRYLQSRGSSTE